jgi:MEDS: MEthanogen/methylotroph, DcmR Sensory domain
VAGGFGGPRRTCDCKRHGDLRSREDGGCYFPAGDFAAALAEARSEGYTGIRVAADNSSVIDTPERLQAWLGWEALADRFMAENPVTGLCAFDRTRVRPASLSAVTGTHRVSMSD